ncbi:hypothetical protein DH2020_020029 [Rehmannia glutinosa]|uniref:Glutaredoxin domain-containing protein n=1 Tax=Rehmannia glutinosa TaxID=99300 RepID=A0ABR0WJR8_REHGL
MKINKQAVEYPQITRSWKLLFSLPIYSKGQSCKTTSMDSISNMVSKNPVVVFSNSSCCISHTIRSLFSDLGVNPTVYELDEIAGGSEIEQALSQLGRNPIVPAVYIGGELVGGANEVISLHLGGSLKPKLINAGALWV